MPVNLFSPLNLGPHTLKNRIAMAPMTRTRADENGVMGTLNASYYAQRASAGLIVSEATQISRQSHGMIGAPGIFSEEQTAGWKIVTDAVHEKGGKIFCQLWHCGRVSDPSLLDGNLPVAPSPIAPSGQIFTASGFKNFVVPRELDTEEIRNIVQEFRNAAKNALAAGFDGVELHGAFGYLVDQFLQSGSNIRRDKYGGTVANRCRFLYEATEALCEVFSPRNVGVKLSPSNRYYGMIDGDAEMTFTHAVKGLSEMNIAYIHMMEPCAEDIEEGDVLKDNAQRFRRHFDGIMIANGGFDLDKAHMILENEGADMVSFGKLFISNPDLPDRLRWKKPLNGPDFSTFYGTGEKGYTDYPFLSSHPYMALIEKEN